MTRTGPRRGAATTRGTASLAVVTLLALGVAGCGDGEDSSATEDPDQTGGTGSSSSASVPGFSGGDRAASAPDDASVSDFCAVREDLADERGTEVELARTVAARLAEVGTPTEFGEDERVGFELFVGYLAEADAAEIHRLDEAADLGELFATFGTESGAKVKAFIVASSEICAERLGSDAG